MAVGASSRLSVLRSTLAATRGRLLQALPEGRGLPDDVWQRRHRVITVVLMLHAVGITLAGFVLIKDPLHTLAESTGLWGMLAVASWRRGDRRLRAAAASLGLLIASSLMVHLSGGLIEMHFHFFVMIAVITLYQHWLPFLIAIGYVVVHHGLIGVIDPRSVYNHGSAWENPWLWALIHGTFVLAASAAHLASWRLNEYQGLHDPLTRLANRVLFCDRVERARQHRRPTPATLAVLFIDLDGFKAINDRFGHEAGDAVLRAVAGRLRSCVRAADTVARFGGDEFAILVEEIGDTAIAVQVADRIIQAVRKPIACGGKEVFVRASVGIAIADSADDDVSTLLRNADVAMYLAKSQRRGRYEIFQPSMYQAVLERLTLKADLERALAEDQFTLHYQPTVALGAGRLSGFEALLRWEHPQHGRVSPATFIPLAEETGLIVPLGRWVLERACRQVREWQRAYPDLDPLTVSVNLSTRQLQQAGIVDEVAAALQATGIDPALVVLEITESALMQDLESTSDRLRQLKALGVRLAVDDFGTGYSSLSYLQRLPVDILKIDKSFVDGVAANAQQNAFAQTIIQMGRTLHLQTVAEGIESGDQRDELHKLGCDLGQGYFFARPLDSASVEALLRERASADDDGAMRRSA
jgi:diguanylate cyclase (GGDEF)-like protein